MDEKLRQLDAGLLQAMDKVSASLTILATVQLAKEFYGEVERKDFLNKYTELVAADHVAYEELQAVTKARGKESHEEIANRSGKTAADEQFKPTIDALKRREATSGVLYAFRREHRLIVDLWDAREKISSQM